MTKKTDHFIGEFYQSQNTFNALLADGCESHTPRLAANAR